MITAFINATIFTGEEFLTGKVLLTEGDRIRKIADQQSITIDANIIDCNGGIIAPGFIDLQIAGGGGFLFSDSPTPEALLAITESIVRSGTTGFLIAIPTNSEYVYHKAIEVIKENPHPAVLGLHLEGPFINPSKAGAHSKHHIAIPGIRDITDLLSGASGVVKMMTVAPESCTPEVIKVLKDYGVTVAAGHSNASFAEATRGFRNGITTVTHLFNAMSPLHHRDPGLPGAAFMSKDVYSSIIADGIHVSYDMIALSKSIMHERLYLVSDAVEESSHGPYLHVRQKDRFTLPDGTLSGSSLSMIQAVRNCVQHVNIPLEESLRMASLYPARVIKCQDRGLIKEGYRADLTIFSRDFVLTDVIINGNQLK
ncbi:MAG TPA: N-acetylglucosamine-6-phosphate deacetylase [Bacteroidales bacterium]|mgnify:CR=1 FL=1|nr:N-acetylglucosamine-6-phosphate deacetylase [Bacteroidales bacterium]HPT11764.1 N-acetylglucosamine-6-phosphate deacetylase [Bacteroidales bacterium]